MKLDTMTFRLVHEEEMTLLLPILSLITPFRSEEALTAALQEMFGQGYRCAAAFDGTRCIGVVGLWIQTKFYIGRHVEYDHLFILPPYRRRGIGERLLQCVDRYALERGCIAAELICDITEERSRRFWESHRFETVGTRYRKRFVRNPPETSA